MLSPRKPKPSTEAPGELLLLHRYDYTVDDRCFHNALDVAVARLGTFIPQSVYAGESLNCRDLARFLTGCVQVCHDALYKQEGFPTRQERWCNNLGFTVGNPVQDGVEDAAPLKPSITGGKGTPTLEGELLYWKPPADKPAHRVTTRGSGQGVETHSRPGGRSRTSPVRRKSDANIRYHFSLQSGD